MRNYYSGHPIIKVPGFRYLGGELPTSYHSDKELPERVCERCGATFYQRAYAKYCRDCRALKKY